MKLEEVAKIASDKAIEVAVQETAKFKESNLEVEIDDELRAKVKERAVSQISFHLNSFRPVAENENDLDDEFEAWFKEAEETDLRTACQHCLKDAVARQAKNEDANLSFLDKYLLERKNWQKEHKN